MQANMTGRCGRPTRAGRSGSTRASSARHTPTSSILCSATLAPAYRQRRGPTTAPDWSTVIPYSSGWRCSPTTTVATTSAGGRSSGVTRHTSGRSASSGPSSPRWGWMPRSIATRVPLLRSRRTSAATRKGRCIPTSGWCWERIWTSPRSAAGREEARTSGLTTTARGLR